MAQSKRNFLSVVDTADAGMSGGSAGMDPMMRADSPPPPQQSISHLLALCPRLRRISLVVSWFGDDLRAGSCRVEPRVEIGLKTTNGATWLVAGLDRANARIVSQSGGRTSADHQAALNRWA